MELVRYSSWMNKCGGNYPQKSSGFTLRRFFNIGLCLGPDTRQQEIRGSVFLHLIDSDMCRFSIDTNCEFAL